jgi:hypothetical protein
MADPQPGDEISQPADKPSGGDILSYENNRANWANAVTVVKGPFVVTSIYGVWVYRHDGDVATITGNGACRWLLPAGAELRNKVPPQEPPDAMASNVGLVGGFYLRI